MIKKEQYRIMFRFTKKCFFKAIAFYYNVLNVNPLECV